MIWFLLSICRKNKQRFLSVAAIKLHENNCNSQLANKFCYQTCPLAASACFSAFVSIVLISNREIAQSQVVFLELWSVIGWFSHAADRCWTSGLQVPFTLPCTACP